MPISMPVTWYPYPDTPWTLSTAGNSTIALSSASTVYYTTPTIWTTGGTVTAGQLNGMHVYYDAPAAPPELVSEEEQAAQEVRRAQAAARAEERRQAHVAAVDRATQLLLSILDEVQAAAYLRDQMFEVVGSHGGLYRIRPGSMANVDALDPVTRAVTGRLCAHPRLWDGQGELPDPDIALAQMLDLTTDEPGFCRTANVHGGRRPAVAALAA